MQSVIPPGDPSRTIIAGKSQGWRGLAVNYGSSTFEELVRMITATIMTNIHYGETTDSGQGDIIFPTMTTAWEPTPAELAALNSGAKVIIQQLGAPPIRPMSVFTGECPSDG